MNTVDKLISEMQKKYGEGSILSLKEGRYPDVERIPVDSPKIADVLGGGLPKGRSIELFGNESAGKSSLACYLAGQAQKHFFKDKNRNGLVAFIDAEHSLDLEYANTMGFDTEKAIISQPDSGEQALDIALDLVKSGEIDFIVIDSVAALTPRAELEGQMGDQQMGLQARMMGKGMRKITAALNYSKCSILFLNQIREKIGGYSPVGVPTDTPGGRALKFFTSIRMEIRRVEFINESGVIMGLRSRLSGIKNKTAPPMKKHEIDFIFGKGINSNNEWIDFAIKYDVIKQGGAWFTCELTGERTQGKEKMLTYLKENPDIYDLVIMDTKKRMYPKVVKEEKLEIKERPKKEKTEESENEQNEQNKQKEKNDQSQQKKVNAVRESQEEKEATTEKPRKRGRPPKTI